MPIDTDRVRRHTAPSVLRQIDDESVGQLMKAINQPETLATRLSQLDAQWDLDRTLETEAALMGLFGLALGVFVKRELLVVPAAVGASVLVFAAVGAYPLLPLFRRAGIRSAREIQRERYALKALRGDFSELPRKAGQSAQTPLH